MALDVDKMNYLNDLKVNPDNPRFIREEDFEKLVNSLREFPEMLEKRPIVYDEDNIILGGNMRFRALQELVKEGFEIKDEYFQSADDWTEEQKRAFVIKDNAMLGNWDTDILANKWDDLPLDDWGIDTDPWRTVEVEEDDGGGLCPYSSWKKFMENWTTDKPMAFCEEEITQQREEAVKEIKDECADISMMMETTLGYLDMAKHHNIDKQNKVTGELIEKAIHHLEVAQRMNGKIWFPKLSRDKDEETKRGELREEN